ncbi:hypothetical protein B0H14DRAFT_2450952 [Mycena olivaceomarginata]|nr:hypothetical protein B0H14DRAFT_2450952 [Mycena olivaceomarginata]
MMPDVKSDLKETDKAGNPHGRPSPQTLSPPDVTSGLSVADVFAHPRNNVVISRTWGGLKLNHVIVDPNVQMPKSLLQRSYLTSIYDLPATNLTLSVTFGTIDADVEVRPFAAGTAHAASPTSYVARYYERKPHQVHLKFGSITGNATFRVYAPSTVRIFMETSVTFGQTRMYLPRTFHGPLKISSWARAPRLSAELRNACILMTEDGSTMHCFVGNVGAWVANGERGDSAKVTTAFGSVWVGYVGEDEEGARALKGKLAHWGKNLLALFFLLCTIYWTPVLLWRLICVIFSFMF